jgi:hypothetical protein
MRIAVVMVLVLLSSACDAARLGPEVACDEAQLGEMGCQAVVDAADAQLDEVGEITRLTVSSGHPCPIDDFLSGYTSGRRRDGLRGTGGRQTARCPGLSR